MTALRRGLWTIVTRKRRRTGTRLRDADVQDYTGVVGYAEGSARYDIAAILEWTNLNTSDLPSSERLISILWLCSRYPNPQLWQRLLIHTITMGYMYPGEPSSTR